jgi:hypothetical protein
VRSVGERLMLFCYMYDPKAGAYTLRAVRVMQVAGVLTVLGLGTLISAMFIGERIRRRAWAATKNGQQDGAGDLSQGGDISSGMTA